MNGKGPTTDTLTSAEMTRDRNTSSDDADKLPNESTPSASLLTNLEDTIAKFSDGNILMHSASDMTEESLIQRYSPPGLEEPFKQLHSIIAPSLHRSRVGGDDVADGILPSEVSDPVSSSSAAILMGSKGSGKSLLLERVLEACEEQQKHRGGARYRMVNINGIICRGQDVATVVYEIVRQLSEIAFQSASAGSALGAGDADEGGERDVDALKAEHARRKRQKVDRHLLRLRKSAFTSNLALLESTLQIADVDQIPILIVLDELDSFTEEGERQMLLYHFLDRVATPGSNLIFIGITSSFSTLTLLEKRIRSRAEGTAKVIYLRPPQTYTDLMMILRHKLKDCLVCEDIMGRISLSTDVQGRPAGASKPTPTAASSAQESRSVPSERLVQDEEDCRAEKDNEIAPQVSIVMEREFRLGKDLRWFSRVVSTALSLYRHDCLMGPEAAAAAVPNFRTSHLVDALVMMEASINETGAATKQADFCIINGVAVDPRLQALLDLSTPQVALLLSARRILAREKHKEQVEATPLSLERMLKEYESFRRGSASQGNTKLLKRAAHDLLEIGLLVPSMDHSGGGALQYSVTKLYRNLDPYTLCRLPLQMPLEIDRELGKALEENLLECPTALKEWGRAIR